MSISRGGGLPSSTTPPNLQINSSGQLFDLKLLGPKLVPLGEVTGFSMEDAGFLDQAQVDRAVANLQAFIAAAPEDDQLVYSALLAQAAEYGEANWPSG